MSNEQILAVPARDVAHSPAIAADRAARGLPALRTERAVATVLFTDIQGSMELSRSVEPELWWSVICGLVELMCEGVRGFAGWMGNFTGDGIEAVFQDTRDLADHAERASRAALWLQAAIEARARELLRKHRLELSVRIGLNSGEVLIGTIVDEHNRYYTATGYAVALAKRVEGLAAPGRIYLSEHTARLLGPDVALRHQGTFDVKGAPLPIDVFELMARESSR